MSLHAYRIEFFETAIFELFWQTYEKSATKFERLTRKFFEVISEKPAAHFIILRESVTDEMVAFMLFFDMGERLMNMYTLTFHKITPGGGAGARFEQLDSH